MASPSTIDRITAEVLRSKWIVALELLLILAPTTLFMVPALLLLSAVVLINPIAVPPLTLTAIGGIWGLVSLWQYCLSLFRPLPTPSWARYGLLAGSLTVIVFCLFGKNRPFWLLACVPMALHWFWLRGQRIVFSFRTPNASR
jgi:hypothetical protein